MKKRRVPANDGMSKGLIAMLHSIRSTTDALTERQKRALRLVSVELWEMLNRGEPELRRCVTGRIILFAKKLALPLTLANLRPLMAISPLLKVTEARLRPPLM